MQIESSLRQVGLIMFLLLAAANVSACTAAGNQTAFDDMASASGDTLPNGVFFSPYY